MVYHIVGLGRDKHKRNMTNELSMAEYMQEKTIKIEKNNIAILKLI